MKLNLDPTVTTPRHNTAEAEALADWYDAHPTFAGSGPSAARWL
jgi:hypothetical protein